MTLTLRSYQIEGRDFLAARRFALLGDEMRLGKSAQAILAAEKVGAERIVVVCPAIAVPQWHQEFKRWIKVWPATGVPMVVLSYDKARAIDWTQYSGRFDVAIVDECHFAKNPEAQRTKAIFGKDGLGWHADRMWCLSGTPATKHAGELWPMLRAFGVVECSYWQFCQAYCTYDWTKTKITGTRQSKIPEVKALLAKVMLRRTRKEVAPEMDDISFSFLAIEPVSRVDLPAPKDFLGASISNEETIADWYEGQIESRKEVALAKVPALVEEITGCLERGDYQQTVVFAWHRDAITVLDNMLRNRNVKVDYLVGGQHETVRTGVQQGFRNGKVQVVVAQIIAAGTAIDLSAASHGYFLELDWLPANNIQAANRLVSLMKAEPVTFDICAAPGTIDDRVQRILLRRSREIKEMI